MMLYGVTKKVAKGFEVEIKTKDPLFKVNEYLVIKARKILQDEFENCGNHIP